MRLCRSSWSTRSPREPFRGNPAAVVLGHGDPAWMQRVAAEMKHSETAFVRPRDRDGEYDLRWFTPEVEVDLCGHATLASAHVLWEHEQRRARRRSTRAAACCTRRTTTTGTITLDFPVVRAGAGAAEPRAVRRARASSRSSSCAPTSGGSAASSTTPRPCASLAPDFHACEPRPERSRRLRHRARRQGATTSCRAASRRASASTRTR